MARKHGNDVRAFRDFLEETLKTAPESLTLDDVLSYWDCETQAEAEREETIQAIREGLEDMYAGRTRPAEDALRDLRRKFNMSQMQQSPTNNVLSQLLEPVGQMMPVEFARQLSVMRATPEVQARIDELADKNNEGELTDDERAEYLAYVDAIDVMSILQAKARSVLARDEF